MARQDLIVPKQKPCMLLQQKLKGCKLKRAKNTKSILDVSEEKIKSYINKIPVKSSTLMKQALMLFLGLIQLQK